MSSATDDGTEIEEFENVRFYYQSQYDDVQKFDADCQGILSEKLVDYAASQYKFGEASMAAVKQKGIMTQKKQALMDMLDLLDKSKIFRDGQQITYGIEVSNLLMIMFLEKTINVGTRHFSMDVDWPLIFESTTERSKGGTVITKLGPKTAKKSFCFKKDGCYYDLAQAAYGAIKAVVTSMQRSQYSVRRKRKFDEMAEIVKSMEAPHDEVLKRFTSFVMSWFNKSYYIHTIRK